MAVINSAPSAVNESLDISAASLNLNARAAAIRPSVAGIWELEKSTAESLPGEESTLITHDLMQERGEAVVSEGGKDGRTLVEPKHFAPGGKYRSIVKLFCRHEFQPKGSWLLGTGWLIRDDLLVTAGHCTYDWAHTYGRLVEAKAYIGYHGKQNAQEPNVQLRFGRKVVAPVDWLTSKGQKPRDVGFIQLDRPFTGVTPIRFIDTPSTGKGLIGVVGYPGDKQDANTQEKGAHMYEMFKESAWNLALTEDTMLEYQIDTYGGNSGSPVLVEGRNASIGVHVYGGSSGTSNSASVIGKLGNHINEYLRGFDQAIPKDKALHLKIVSGHLAESAVAAAAPGAPAPGLAAPYGPAAAPGFGGGFAPAHGGALRQRRSLGHVGTALPVRAGHSHTAAGAGYGHMAAGAAVGESGEESIFSIIKSVANVGLPMLGPIGMAANVALNVASKLAESVEAGGGAESVAVGGAAPEGVMERAVMAEAALVHLQKMNLSQAEEEGILSDIADTVKRVLPVAKQAAMAVLPPMLETALKVTTNHLHQYNQARGGGAESMGSEAIFAVPSHEMHNCWMPPGHYSAAIDRRSLHAGAEAIIAHAESAGGEESFGDFLKAGLRLGGQGLAMAAKHGLPIIAQMAASALGGAESTEVGVHPIIAPGGTIHTDLLAKRAVVGEAALQAILKLPPHRLQEEGFLDTLRDVGAKLLPIAKVVAPVILDQVHPMAGQIARSVLRQESALVGAPNTGLINHPTFGGNIGGGASFPRRVGFGGTLGASGADSFQSQPLLRRPGSGILRSLVQ